ncbi:MAG: hypothetical protein GX663_09970 [Clostridiales bacterium]|nr:hypothetical protein [Clostridiales bacterium]
MIRRNRARSSSLFLLELIISILFFSIASAICVQLFVKSHTLNTHAQELDFAVNECCSIAEIITSEDSREQIQDTMNVLYPDGLYFDKDYNPCSEKSAYYVITVDMTADGSLLQGSIAASHKDKTIYSLEIKHNLQKEAKR